MLNARTDDASHLKSAPLIEGTWLKLADNANASGQLELIHMKRKNILSILNLKSELPPHDRKLCNGLSWKDDGSISIRH